MPSVMCVRAYLCVFVTFLNQALSHSFMKISSPNLQRMFMTVKTCLKNYCTHLKIKNMAIIADFSKMF